MQHMFLPWNACALTTLGVIRGSIGVTYPKRHQELSFSSAMTGLIQRRFKVLLRVSVAIGGGYAFAVVASVGLLRWLPLPPEQAVMSALLLTYFFYTVAVLWVFAVRSTWRACLGLVLPTLLLAWWLWPLSDVGPG